MLRQNIELHSIVYDLTVKLLYGIIVVYCKIHNLYCEIYTEIVGNP